MDTPYLYLDLQVRNKPVIGEATERFFENQIAIESLTWEMDSTHTPLGQPELRRVKTEKHPKRLTLIKAFDRATINLCDYMAKGQQFEEATITMVKSLAWEEKRRPLIEMTLTKGYVESVTLNASEGGKSVNVKETVTLSFKTMKILYYSNVESSLAGNAATTFELDMPSEIS